MNYSIPAHLVLKEGIHGVGVFITEDLSKGEVIFYLTGEVLPYPTRTSIQIAPDQHIENTIGGHVNHSCHPTAYVDRALHALVSLRDIQKNEEITFNYNINEDELANPFICGCCNVKICGKQYIESKVA